MPARFYLPENQWKHDILDGEEAKHALKVLRLKSGADIELFNGNGRVSTATITSISGKSLSFKKNSEQLLPKSEPEIHLYQAVPKGKNMELIIQKAVELGVSSIQPIITDNTIAISDTPERKTNKWRKIALEACKQCKQPYLPQIAAPLNLYAINTFSGELKVMGALTEKAIPLRNALPLSPPASIGIAIGPEGDFSKNELFLLENSGFLPTSLGNLILRVETATLFTLSSVRYQYT